jgi:hypothetical protein
VPALPLKDARNTIQLDDQANATLPTLLRATRNTSPASERVVLGTKTARERTILNRNRLARRNLLNDPEGQ